MFCFTLQELISIILFQTTAISSRILVQSRLRICACILPIQTLLVKLVLIALFFNGWTFYDHQILNQTTGCIGLIRSPILFLVSPKTLGLLYLYRTNLSLGIARCLFVMKMPRVQYYSLLEELKKGYLSIQPLEPLMSRLRTVRDIWTTGNNNL